MLPVATPPNAIVFSAAKMNPVEMVNRMIQPFRQINLHNVCLLFSTDESWLVHELGLRDCHLRPDANVGQRDFQQ
jgi:hypothetical protein